MFPHYPSDSFVWQSLLCVLLSTRIGLDEVAKIVGATEPDWPAPCPAGLPSEHYLGAGNIHATCQRTTSATLIGRQSPFPPGNGYHPHRETCPP